MTTQRYAYGFTLTVAILLGGVVLACSHTPDPQAVQDVHVRPLERIHVTELEDRLRLELEAGEALSYSLSTNQVPASVTIHLPGRSRGAGLSPLEINAGPVLRVVPQEVQKPRLGLELVVSLTHPVKPETQVRGTRLIVDFPRNKSQVESKTVGTADRLGSGMPERAVAPAMEIPPRSFARDGREGKAPQGIKPAKLMTKVEIRRGERDATVVIFGDGTFTYEVLLVDQKRLVVDLAGVASQLRLQTLPVHHSLLRQIRVGEHPNKTRLVFDLAVPVQYVVEAKGDQLTVRLTSSAEAPIPSDAVSQPAPPPASPEPVAAPRPSEAAPEAAQGVVRRASATTSGTVPFPDRLAILQQEPRLAQMAPETRGPNGPVVVGERKYVGRRISLDFQQADLINVLRLIAEVSGFNIVVGEGVKNKVTIKLVNVPWDQALDMLLKMNNLGMIREGNIVWIDTLSNIARQQEEEAKLKESKEKAEELITKVIYVQNIPAQTLQNTLRQYLSPRGSINFNQQSNALIIKDTESNIAVVQRLIEGLDQPERQVHIEARIVQADTSYARSLGIQWGVVDSSVSSNGNFRVFGNLTGPFSEVKLADNEDGTFETDFMINLPAAVTGLSSVPSIGLMVGKLIGGFGLDARLSAGELLGLTKVIAAPKITTLNNQEAKIEQGESIPFQTTSLQGTQTTFVDANLTLQVTPQITSRDPKEKDARIILKVKTTRNAVGARSNPAGPSIDKREATTQVMLRNGETMVMGGIYVDTQTNTVAGLPWMSRIPVLGWLFKNKSESIAKQELLIFLTPTLIET